ncbi:glycosyltransferase [Brevibacillus sp. SYSU BS000544]|uniref:glycosyltransferase n=1 Tax=Brevibacillus sp. SYSU BS000544 TaxID=3416443 RepID=UPI003CE546AA
MDRILLYRRNYLPISETFIYQQLIGHTKVKPIVLSRSKPVNLSSFPYDPIYVRKSLKGLSSWLKRKKIRVMHARFGPAGLDLLSKARKTRIPLITSFHGVDVSKRVKQNRIYRIRLRKLFKKGDAFTVVSEHMRNKLRKLGCPDKKITLIRSGIDLNYFSQKPLPPVKNGEFRLLSVGRLVEKKGMDILIKSFAKLRRVYPRARLTIVGEGEERRRLKRLIKKYKLERYITMKGAKTRSGVRREMEACHLFVNASKTAKDGNQEGIPNVIMESMAVGRPVVSTFHAGIPELVDHQESGFLVKEGSVSELSDMMMQALFQYEMWSEIIDNARAKVEKNHDISKQRLLLENLYLDLIRRRSSRM